MLIECRLRKVEHLEADDLKITVFDASDDASDERTVNDIGLELTAYHGQGRNPGAHDVLLELAAAVGLDATEAAAVLADGRYGAEVRAAEREWQQAGIQSVPAIVINRQHLISGGQPPEVFEQALRQIAQAEVKPA